MYTYVNFETAEYTYKKNSEHLIVQVSKNIKQFRKFTFFVLLKKDQNILFFFFYDFTKKHFNNKINYILFIFTLIITIRLIT